MTKEQSAIWTAKLSALEERITQLKHEAGAEFVFQTGSHPLVHALAALESLAWATKDVVYRFPTTEDKEAA